MKTILGKFFLFFTLSVFIAGCKQNMPTQAGSNQLYGSWQWIKTQGGLAGQTYTPNSTGYTAKVVFLVNGFAQYYRNDTLTSLVKFTIVKKKLSSNDIEVELLHFNNGNFLFDQVINFQGSDSLLLSDYAADGFNYFYTRIHQ